MPIQALNRLAARVAGKLPLQTVLIVPFVVQIVGTVGLVGYLSYKNGYQEVSNLATQLQLEINYRINQHLDCYLAVPSQLNKINVDAYELKLLNFFEFKSTGQYFWKQLQVFNISYINFATANGEFIGAGDYGHGSIQIEEIPKNSQGKSYKYDTDKKGDRTRLISVQDFDPHKESWYFNAVKAGKPVWSEIYNWNTNPEIMSIAASYPLYDENKTLIGVTGIDLKLSDISGFLKKITIGKSGKAFILERSGLIVASSVNEPSFTRVNGKAKRLNAATSRTLAIQLTTQYLQKHFGNLNRIEKSYQLNLDLSGQRQYVQVSPWRDKLGLNWLVVVVIPEADFTEQINANTRTTILLCITALIGSIGVGILTARWITKPILRINTAAKEIAKGEWDKPVEIERTDEVGELANSFNTMAAQLQQSFAELNSLNAALAQRESQLRQFLDAIPVGVSIHEATGKILYFNQTAKQLLGIASIPDSANQELAQVYQLYRQNQLYPTEDLPALRALKGETVFVEDIELHRDGEIIPFEIRATPIFDEQGNIIYAITGFQDITERKQSKEILANYNRTLEIKIAERTAELVGANEQLKYEMVERQLLDGKLHTSTQQVRTIFESIPDIVLIIDEYKSLQVIPTKAIDWNADETNLLNWIVEPFFQEDTEEIWFAKVQQVRETQQSINFDYSLRINNREIWYTACISPLPDNSVVWVARDITDRIQVKQALQVSQSRFAGILEIANDAIITVDAEQRITLFNQGAEKIFGYRADEAIGQPLDMLLPTAVRGIHHQHVNEFSKSVGQARRMAERSEIFGRRKDGTEFPAEASISQLEINGEKFFTTILRDISDRKLAELALQTKTEELDRFFGASLDLLCIANTDGYFLRLNPQWEKTLGYRLEDLEGSRFLDYVHPEDLESTLDAIAQLANQEDVPNFVNRYRCRNGLYRWIEWRSVPVGNLIYAGARDITERTQAEEALRQSEATNRAILSAIPDLLIWMSQDGTYLEIAIGRDFKLFNPGQSYVGSNIYNVLPHPIARKRMKYVQRALQTSELQVYEHEIVVDGETLYEETRIAASDNGKVLVIVRDITARKRTEESLREREEQLQLALEGSGDGFWDWKIPKAELYLSPRYLEMLGYEADELPQEFSTWDRLIHPDDKPWVMETLNAHLADSSVPYKFDYRLLTKSGDWKWIANYGKVVARAPNGAPLRMTGTHRDVSDRKRAELELQEREYRLRTLADNLPNGLIYQLIQEPNGKVYFSYITAGIERLVGIKPEVVMQDPSVLHNLIIEEDRLLNEQLTEESRLNLSLFEMQMRKRTTTGKIQWSYVRSAPRRLEDGRTVWDGIEIDITNLKQAEAELAKAKEAAEAANRAKSAFLANMSHELRTPLNGILGYAQILQRDSKITPKQKEGVDIIYQCGMHLLTLINDILDLSKIEAGKLELYPEDLNFPSFLTDITEIFRLKAIQKSLTFTYLPLSELPTVIHADEKRLRQVLMNLLSNAVKFTDAGSVTFKVEVIAHGSSVINREQEQLPITHHPSPITYYPLPILKIRFQVEDTGIGISSEQLEKIFLPFEQVGDSSRRAEGTGLGLAITQKILELMGGKVLVESTPQVGSRFGFDLDVPVVSTPMKSTTVKITDTIIGYSGSKRKILIVDDRWENRAVFVNILEPIGFELEEAADGQEGLEKALEFQPDLILADLVMPVMDGYQMTQRLRQLKELHKTIIIAISANAFVVDRQKSLESGCNDFLPKPVQAKDLLDKIQSYLNLSWIYDSESKTQSEELGNESSRYTQVALTEMVMPAKEELLGLYEAANTGYVQSVEQEIIRLQQLSPEYTPFATRILELANDFEYEEIANLIYGYLSKDSE